MAANNYPSQTENSIIEEVRSYLRDYKELNRLILGEETSTFQMRWLLAGVLSRIADSPPLLGFFQVSQVPRYLLRDGLVAEALLSAAIFYARNSLEYTDGQIGVRLDKHREYLAMGQLFYARFENSLREWKMSTNIAGAMNANYGMHSDYFYFSAGFYGDFPSTVDMR